MHDSAPRTWLLVASCIALFSIFGAQLGCAPALSTMEPARVIPRGHLQITSSVDINSTSGPIRDAIDGAAQMDNPNGSPTAADIERLANAATALLIQPPALGYQVSLSYGIARRLEIGVRSSVQAVRGWARWQFLRDPRNRLYGALSLGGTGYVAAFPIEVFTDQARVESFGRREFDASMQLGFSGRVAHLWAGPKIVLSSYEAQVWACVEPTSSGCARDGRLTFAGTAAYLAGQVGLAVGYRRFWVALELTVAHVGTDARLEVISAGVRQGGPFRRDGWLVSPSVGVILWM